MNKTFLRAPYVGICFTEADYLEEMKRLNVTYFDRWVTKGATGTTHTFDNEDGEQTVIVCVELSEEHSLNENI
ncbi:MAG: hypothetical protein KDI51_21160, partial [Xanthomonadales bacterium]|nr:hypothetical protein [Xanthomonadales bacterium]